MANWTFKGKVWMFGDNINTDYMMPGFTPRGISMQDRTRYCMKAIRPDWVEQVKPGDVIVGGDNFGCGSNRPAAQILKLLGLSCLVAESINSLMFRNCVNFSMPAISCRGVSKAFTEGDTAEVDIETGVVKNLTSGEVLITNPMPKQLLDIMDTGGLLSLLKKQKYIEKVEYIK